MRVAVYPGSFDPVTNGHLDIIARSSRLFDQLYVVIMQNPQKKNTFSLDERVEMLKMVTKDYNNVGVMAQMGLTVNVAKELQASFLIRGIRATMDFEMELQQATANMALAPDLETVFFVTKPENSFISSSTVKEIALNQGDISNFVPASIVDMIMEKYR
ncbi:MAG: pantetheine-phosphate adenylyltransferase [Erysipelotrichaceae bacterium]|nr:pantetheine-phosphate adenylyltransferase [Erysipelotrichaceae bacterium]MDD3923639.1 pantetheine-phosphate adenylyltransferase [Erysipelotrichaceae bacterium]MDD4641994.1 pantetheine-phosphate adenylyltransferase [Erysipelotrichaceae bacterium]